MFKTVNNSGIIYWGPYYKFRVTKGSSRTSSSVPYLKLPQVNPIYLNIDEITKLGREGCYLTDSLGNVIYKTNIESYLKILKYNPLPPNKNGLY
jgi:hypothetical protein